MFSDVKWSDWVQLVIALSSVVAAMVALGRVLPPSWRLLRAGLFQDRRWPALAIVRELVRCLWVPFTWRLYSAARLRVELELLKRPTEPAELPAWKRKLNTELKRVWRDRTLEVDNCFALHRARKDIRRYFDVIEHESFVPEGDKHEFLTDVRVTTGFVAPLHLLGGLLGHLEEDWTLVIRGFGAAMARTGSRLPASLRALQAFLWDCWLLWGPSVPLCTCSRWLGEDKALQYGYGDENNSIPLVFRGDESARTLLEDARRQLHAPGEPFRMAHKMTVTAKPTSPAGLASHAVSPAQQNIRDVANYEFVMRYVAHRSLPGGFDEDQANRYYSAYVWVMFALVAADGSRLAGTDQPDWRDLIPFFEHGNIADATTYAFFKEQVARKALAGIRLLQESDPGMTGIRFEYVGAVDDSGCGAEPFFSVAGQTSIRAHLAGLLKKEFEDLLASGRVVVPEKPRAQYDACHLDHVIGRFYTQVKEWLAGASRPGASR